MGYEEQLRARAELLDDTTGLALEVTDILMGAEGAGYDPRIVPGLQVAIRVLDPAHGEVGYDAGIKKDRYRGGGFSSDAEFLEELWLAAGAVRERFEFVRKLDEMVDEAFDKACDDLAEAKRALERAYAMPVMTPWCDGCHDRKQRAIEEAKAAIKDAERRIDICEDILHILKNLMQRLNTAYGALCRVPHDLGAVYALLYAFVAKGGKLPYYGRQVEGESA